MLPDTDLSIERHLNASADTIWRCWTEPDLLRDWFCPRPWTVSEAVIEPFPGGRFMTVMRGPDGTEHPNEGCILAADPARRIVFTDALHAGFRPSGTAFITADIRIVPDGAGCIYRAHVMHATEADRTRHEEMGFHEGWSAAIDQLAELAQKTG